LKEGKIVGTISDYHHDDMTCLNFSNTDKTKLIAGSDDGYLCTYNLNNADLDEVNKLIFLYFNMK
jgi:WD40 repeat protein